MKATSPFPGMDLFLEEPSEWSSIHAWFITTLSEQLADLVSPNFFVKIEQRVYITSLDNPQKRPLVPDVYVITDAPRQAGVAVAAGVIAAPTLIEPLYEPEIRDTGQRELVATLEILSPFNKTSGTPGRQAFLHKRQTVMASKVHWLEIDLLRAGERPPEVSGQSDYYALLNRGDAPGPFEVWFIDLRDRLPTIAVPLRPPFADVPLDLQAALDTVYRRAHYADSLDYRRPVPQPALRPADATWARDKVRVWLGEPEKRDAA